MPGLRTMVLGAVGEPDARLERQESDGHVVFMPAPTFVMPPTCVAIGISYNQYRNTLDVIVADESFAEVDDGDMPPELRGWVHWIPSIDQALTAIEPSIPDIAVATHHSDDVMRQDGNG